MRTNDKPMRAAAAFCFAFILTALPGLAAAENSVRFGAGTYTSKIKIKDSIAPTDARQKGAHGTLDLRFDVAQPVFLTLGALGFTGDIDFPPDPSSPDTRVNASDQDWGYRGGLGYLFMSSRSGEAWLRGEYTHLRSSGKAFLDDPSIQAWYYECCHTQDLGALSLGTSQWLAPWVKVYGEASFFSGNAEVTYLLGHRKAQGYGVNAGLEFELSRMLRVFAEYDYRDLKLKSSGSTDPTAPNYDPESEMKPAGFTAGFKIPFGQKPAPVRKKKADPAPAEESAAAAGEPATDALPAAAAAPAATVPASAAPAPAPAAGRQAMLKPGALLRGQPKPDGAELNTDTSQPVTLKAMVTKADGKWWYVTMARGGGGWVEESRFTVLP